MALLRHPATGDFGRAERLCARREIALEFRGGERLGIEVALGFLALLLAQEFRLRGRLLARLDIRDQLTRFPQKIITAAPGLTLGGWLHDLVPTVGLSWLM